MKCLQFAMIVSMLMILACQCKDDDMDPCLEATPVDAEFVIEQGVGFNEDRRYFESDTLTYGNIRFRALHDLDAYTWTIGGDPRVFNTKEVELNFDRDLEGTSIEVSLNGTWTPNLDCFPQDTGEGSSSKSFYIIPIPEVPYFGEFKGVVESAPQDTFTISIIHQPEVLSAYIDNLPDGCERDSQSPDTNFTGTYRDFLMPNYRPYIECSIPKGWGHIEDNLKDLTIDYEIWDQEIQQKINDRFVGTKIE